MPAAYTHYRFGKEVYRSLPVSVRKEIIQALPLYKIGLQGPDILFFYRPLFKNKISSTGFQMHTVSAEHFFDGAAQMVKNRKQLSYLLGFVCHFVLDSTCHGFIEEYIQSTGIGHSEIEMEFDRMLMIKDGQDPTSCQIAKQIQASEENAEVIQGFFPMIPTKKIDKALRSMRFYTRLLTPTSSLKRKVLFGGMWLTGNYEKLHGMVINPKGNIACVESCIRLTELYEEAIQTAVDLICDYMKTIKEGKELHQRFHRTFDA